jgi:hypothetical protein
MKLIVWWLFQRAKYQRGRRSRSVLWFGQQIVTHEGKFLFWRLTPYWPDEYVNREGQHFNRAPWWRPFYILLHWWRPAIDTEEAWHDHPRWSVTIVLRGCLVERTPWSERTLRPGAIVIRSRKCIHSFRCPSPGTTWTLFIAGRRNHRQNVYTIKEMSK